MGNLGKPLSWLVLLLVIVQTFLIPVLFYKILDTMVSLKYEPQQDGDFISQAHGHRLVAYAGWIIMSIISNLILLAVFKRGASFPRKAANILFYILLALQVLMALPLLWLVC